MRPIYSLNIKKTSAFIPTKLSGEDWACHTNRMGIRRYNFRSSNPIA